jgi:hypothetical protein
MSLAAPAGMKTLLASLLLVGACATDGGSTLPHQHVPTTEHPTFTLYVSNQSLDRSTIDIQVYIDNRLAVSGDFAVGSQHSWHEFKFDLGEGTHTIRIESDDTSVTTTANITKKFGVANYWYGGEEQETFSFFEQAEQPYFD